MVTLSRLWKSLSKEQVLKLINKYSKRYAAQSTNPSEFVDMIDKAIQQTRKIEIWYTSVADGEEVRRIISPIAWQAKKGFVYVVAYNNLGEVRTYRLDRISKLKETWTDALGGEYDNYYDYYSDDITRQFEPS